MSDHCCFRCGYVYSAIFSSCPDCGSTERCSPPQSDDAEAAAMRAKVRALAAQPGGSDNDR